MLLKMISVRTFILFTCCILGLLKNIFGNEDEALIAETMRKDFGKKTLTEEDKRVELLTPKPVEELLLKSTAARKKPSMFKRGDVPNCYVRKWNSKKRSIKNDLLSRKHILIRKTKGVYEEQNVQFLFLDAQPKPVSMIKCSCLIIYNHENVKEVSSSSSSADHSENGHHLSSGNIKEDMATDVGSPSITGENQHKYKVSPTKSDEIPRHDYNRASLTSDTNITEQKQQISPIKQEEELTSIPTPNEAVDTRNGINSDSSNSSPEKETDKELTPTSSKKPNGGLLTNLKKKLWPWGRPKTDEEIHKGQPENNSTLDEHKVEVETNGGESSKKKVEDVEGHQSKSNSSQSIEGVKVNTDRILSERSSPEGNDHTEGNINQEIQQNEKFDKSDFIEEHRFLSAETRDKSSARQEETFKISQSQNIEEKERADANLSTSTEFKHEIIQAYDKKNLSDEKRNNSGQVTTELVVDTNKMDNEQNTNSDSQTTSQNTNSDSQTANQGILGSFVGSLGGLFGRFSGQATTEDTKPKNSSSSEEEDDDGDADEYMNGKLIIVPARRIEDEETIHVRNVIERRADILQEDVIVANKVENLHHVVRDEKYLKGAGEWYETVEKRVDRGIHNELPKEENKENSYKEEVTRMHTRISDNNNTVGLDQLPSLHHDKYNKTTKSQSSSQEDEKYELSGDQIERVERVNQQEKQYEKKMFVQSDRKLSLTEKEMDESTRHSNLYTTNKKALEKSLVNSHTHLESEALFQDNNFERLNKTRKNEIISDNKFSSSSSNDSSKSENDKNDKEKLNRKVADTHEEQSGEESYNKEKKIKKENILENESKMNKIHLLGENETEKHKKHFLVERDYKNILSGNTEQGELNFNETKQQEIEGFGNRFDIEETSDFIRLSETRKKEMISDDKPDDRSNSSSSSHSTKSEDNKKKLNRKDIYTHEKQSGEESYNKEKENKTVNIFENELVEEEEVNKIHLLSEKKHMKKHFLVEKDHENILSGNTERGELNFNEIKLQESFGSRSDIEETSHIERLRETRKNEMISDDKSDEGSSSSSSNHSTESENNKKKLNRKDEGTYGKQSGEDELYNKEKKSKTVNILENKLAEKEREVNKIHFLSENQNEKHTKKQRDHEKILSGNTERGELNFNETKKGEIEGFGSRFDMEETSDFERLSLPSLHHDKYNKTTKSQSSSQEDEKYELSGDQIERVERVNQQEKQYEKGTFVQSDRKLSQTEKAMDESTRLSNLYTTNKKASEKSLLDPHTHLESEHSALFQDNDFERLSETRKNEIISDNKFSSSSSNDSSKSENEKNDKEKLKGSYTKQFGEESYNKEKKGKKVRILENETEKHTKKHFLVERDDENIFCGHTEKGELNFHGSKQQESEGFASKFDPEKTSQSQRIAYEETTKVRNLEFVPNEENFMKREEFKFEEKVIRSPRQTEPKFKIGKAKEEDTVHRSVYEEKSGDRDESDESINYKKNMFGKIEKTLEIEDDLYKQEELTRITESTKSLFADGQRQQKRTNKMRKESDQSSLDTDASSASNDTMEVHGKLASKTGSDEDGNTVKKDKNTNHQLYRRSPETTLLQNTAEGRRINEEIYNTASVIPSESICVQENEGQFLYLSQGFLKETFFVYRKTSKNKFHAVAYIRI